MSEDAPERKVALGPSSYGSLRHGIDPVVLIFNSTRLDTSQGLAELLHHRADLGVASREGHGLVGAIDLVVNLANRRDDGSGAAQAALDKGTGLDLDPLDGTLVNGHAQVLSNLNERTAGDGGQDGVGVRLRNDERAVLLHEQDVSATGLLDIGAGLGVEIQVLGIALAMGLHRGRS